MGLTECIALRWLGGIERPLEELAVVVVGSVGMLDRGLQFRKLNSVRFRFALAKLFLADMKVEYLAAD